MYPHTHTHTAAEDGSEDDVLTVKPTTWRLKAALGNFTCQQLQVATMCNFKSRLNFSRTPVMLHQKTAGCTLLYVSHRGLERENRGGDQLSLDSCSSFMFWFFTAWFLPTKIQQPKLNLKEGTYTRGEQRVILSMLSECIKLKLSKSK